MPTQPLDKKVYQSEDMQLMIAAHMLRTKKVYDAAARFRITGADFVVDEVIGDQTLKTFVDILAQNKFSQFPIPFSTFLLLVKDRVEKQEIEIDRAAKLSQKLYQIDLNEEFVCSHLEHFVSSIRFEKLKAVSLDDLQALVTGAKDITSSIQQAKITERVNPKRPFDEVIVPELANLTPFGVACLDATIGGIAPGQYGQICGFSGCGKTAFAVYLACNMLRAGRKVLFFSLEEKAEILVQRFYANFLDINYGDLHKGTAALSLRQAFTASSIFPVIKDNFILEDFRKTNGEDDDAGTELKPTAPALREYLEVLYKSQGFAPDVIFIDQVDHMSPSVTTNSIKNAQWQSYEKITFDIHEYLAKQKIGGVHEYTTIALIQANGQPKKFFSRQDIASFKNIIKPADFTIGIGRDGLNSNDFGVFSLKSRHSKAFQFSFTADLEYMRFNEPGFSEGSNTLSLPGMPVNNMLGSTQIEPVS